jgi:uncharacterized membrane protein YhhN
MTDARRLDRTGLDWRDLIFVAALIAGISYYWADGWLTDDWLLTAWKGKGVGLLALWAALRARNRDGWLMALVLALGATGDVLLDALGLIEGAVAFLAGHLVAIWLYLRHRRSGVAGNPMIAGAIALLTAIIAFALPDARGEAPGIALYALGLGAMAGAAWTSRFPRVTVGLGAMLFVLSDLLIFARMGPMAGSALPGLLIWPTYFAGQALIAWGVVRALVREA